MFSLGAVIAGLSSLKRCHYNNALKLLMSLVAVFLVGCGSSDKDKDRPDENHAIVYKMTASVKVELPEDSPIAASDLQVLGNNEQVDVADDLTASIEIDTDQANDVSIFLPSRDGIEPPTIYLNTTVVPGEGEVNLSVEETALSLILSGINPNYLKNVSTATYSKFIAKSHAEAFIAELQQTLSQDPYALRQSNLSVVLGALFEQAVEDTATELDSSIDIYQGLGTQASPASALSKSAAQGARADTSESFVSSADLGDVTIKYDRDPPVQGLVLIPANSLLNDELSFVNGSMLPLLLRVTNTSKNTVMEDIPQSFIEQAYGAAILSPTGGPFGLQLPNAKLIKTGTQNLLVEVYSPGLVDFDHTEYMKPGSPSPALLARAAFSSILLPLLSEILPVARTADNKVVKTVFGLLQNAGVFDKVIYHWTNKQYALGIENSIQAVYSSETLIPSIINVLTSELLSNEQIAAKFAIRVGFKLTAAKLALASTAISVSSVTKGLVSTPHKTSFLVHYPVGLHDLDPREAKKVVNISGNTDLFSVTGHGLSNVISVGETYRAELQLEAFDKDGQKVEEVLLEQEADYQLLPCGSECLGEKLEFKLPNDWMLLTSIVNYVRLTVHHRYIEPGWLANYTDWFNDLEVIALPKYETGKKKFTIHLTQDVRITDVSPRVLEQGDHFVITGEGFTILEREVQVVNYDESTVTASISSVSDERIGAYFPSGAKFNDRPEPSTAHLGSGEFYVELEDGSRSNREFLAVRPRPVTFYPPPVVGQMTDNGTEIALQHAVYLPMFYRINDGPIMPYSRPFVLDNSGVQEITAFSRVVIDGVIYQSDSVTERYVSCPENQVYIRYPHGPRCVTLQNPGLIPGRLCPLNGRDYTGPFLTTHGQISCSYAWLDIASSTVAREWRIHPDSDNYHLMITYWGEPSGRPHVIFRSGKTYQVCPDGSFEIPGQGCHH